MITCKCTKLTEVGLSPAALHAQSSGKHARHAARARPYHRWMNPGSTIALLLAVAVTAGTACTAAQAQSNGLRQPSRTVYKCESAGKVTYSDEPCSGAVRVDVEPTRGMNKSSGREQTGADVARERRREGIAEALRPATGMDAKQFDTLARRQRLAPQAQQECRSLDRALPRAEAAEQRAGTTPSMRAAQENLLTLRRRHLDLGC